MFPVLIRAAARIIPNAASKTWKAITTAKDGYEIIEAAKTFISEMSTPAKIASVATVAGLAAAPFVIPAAINQAKESQVIYEHLPPNGVSVVEDSPQKVYPAAYLARNQHLLVQILNSCKVDPSNVAERCNQATMAEIVVNNAIQSQKLQKATKLTW